MPARNKYILIALAMFLPATILAQGIHVKAIEIYGQNLNGTSDFGDLNSAINNTRNPILFRTDGLTEIGETSELTTNEFAIDFHIARKGIEAHEFILGIQAGTITTDFTTTASVVYDSLNTTTSITNVSEYFNLKAGYQRLYRSDKKLKFSVGGLLVMGFPISSITNQRIVTIRGSDNFVFFGKKSAALGFSLPLSARLKLINNVSISLTSRPTLLLHGVDGNFSSTLFRGTNLGLHFKLRNQ